MRGSITISEANEVCSGNRYPAVGDFVVFVYEKKIRGSGKGLCGLGATLLEGRRNAQAMARRLGLREEIKGEILCVVPD
jgi:hypothetical protein